MAKSTKSTGITAEIVPPHVIEKAQALLTGAEKKFFNSSFGTALAKHSHAQVEATVKQARILRNKWRDLYAGQSRTAKRSGRATAAANVRTREKHDLLTDVVARFEKRLAELKAAVSSSARPAATKAAAATPKKPTKSARKILTQAERRISKKASRRVTAPSYLEANLILECRKIYWQDMDPRGFVDATIKANYPANDYHRIYFGEIMAVLGE
jgi:hypothetical protein